MFKKILLSFFFVANALLLFAQSHYPVQVQPIVITPSVYLQDYVDQNNLQVKVSLNDLSKQNFQIRLKMTISDNKTFIHTSNQGLVLTLNGGQVYFLSDDDLATLFDPADLGIAQNSTLKEGMYSFNFEATTVFDNTVKVSNKSLDFTQAMVVLNDPPLLNMPVKDSELDLTQIGSSIQFGWMPRSFFTSPNRQVKYAIKIVKVDPIETNPYQAIQSTSTNFLLNQDGIDAPFLIYDPSMFQLETGAVYAWQVRAYEDVLTNGIVSKFGARFKNDGYSEVQTFSTKDVCPAISIVAQPAVGANPVVLSWTTGTGAGTPSQYEVQYREQGTTLPYTIVRTSQNSITLDNSQIQEGLTYEYNVAVLCKKWQAPVYGGTFKLQKPSCSPPSPLKIENPNVKGEMVLFWDLPAEQSLTAFKVTTNNGSDGDVEKVIPVVDGTMSYSVTLPVLTSGGYNVQVDGVCDQTNAPGKKQFVAYNDNGFIGACPLPTPLTLYATRYKGDTANITFTNNQLHQSYVLKYWELSKDSSTAITVNIPTALSETKLPNIADNVLYQYRITFVCSGGKTTKTGIGMFKIDPANNLDPNITPPTGNCFPPAQIAAEARSTTSAKFDWGKSTGADEYQLLYRVEGSTGNFQVFNTTASDAKLSGLEDGKIYEYKIKSRCGSAYSIASSLGTVDLSKPTSNSNCDTVSFVRINKVTQTEIQLAWKFEAAPIRTGYTIFYKEDSQAWTDQYVEDFQDLSTFVTTNVSHDTAQFTLINLKPGTKYNFKIQAACGTDKAQANDVISGTTTPDPKPKGCESGKACDRTSNIPKTSLAVGDVIGVADYNVKITEVEPIVGSSPQKFKGNGIAEAPFIGMSENLAMNVSFDNLLVNDKMCTLKGDINLDSASLYILDEKTRNQVKTMVADAHQLAAQAQDVLSQADSLLQIANDAAQQAVDYAQGGGDVGKVKDGGFNEDYTTTTTPTAADAPTKPALVKNTTTGEVYQVDANGTVTKIGQYGTGYTDIEKKPITPVAGVTFKYNPNTSAKYPYDAFIDGYKKATMQSHYLKMGTTYCDAKLILPKELDKVDFTYSGDKSKLKFVNRKGFEYDYSGNTINLVGGPASDAQEIIAVYDDGTTKTVIGALLLASYEPKQKKVILVATSLSGTMSASATQIQTELNKIYGPLGVNYTVTLDESFKTNIDWYSSPNQSTFDAGDNSNLGNKYTADAKEMIDKYIAFKTVDNLDKDAAYLFLVPPSTTPKSATEQLDGKMHFMQQFGFLFDTKSKSASNIALTLAHELGHGNYNIYHVFDDIYLGSSATQSNNLMAYGGGTTLNKLQWDQIHDPGVSWGLFVNDDDQNRTDISNIAALLPFQNPDNRKSFTFMSPAGLPITIPISVKSITFFDEEELGWGDPNDRPPRGALYGFTTANSRRYVASFDFANNKFNGYYDFTNKQYYVDNETPKYSDGDVIVGNTKIRNSAFWFRTYKRAFDMDGRGNGWPVKQTSYLAKGTIEPRAFYSSLDASNNPKVIELYISGTTYNTEQKAFLSLNEGLDDPESMYHIVKINYIFKTTPNLYTNFTNCKGKILSQMSYLTLNTQYGAGGAMGAGSVNVPIYSDYLKTKVSEIISFKSGSGRSQSSKWHPSAKSYFSNIVNKTQSEAIKIITSAKCLEISYRDALSLLSTTERINAIKIILSGNTVLDNDEQAIIDLIDNIHNDSVPKFLTRLEGSSNQYSSNSSQPKVMMEYYEGISLLNNMINSIHGEEFTQFINTISNKVIYNFSQKYTELLNPDNFKERHLSWNEDPSKLNLGDFVITEGIWDDYITLNDNNANLSIGRKVFTGYTTAYSTTGGTMYGTPGYSYSYQAPVYQDATSLSLRPFDLIWISSGLSLEPENKLAKNTILPVPAIMLHHDNQKRFNQSLITTASITFDVASLALTMGGSGVIIAAEAASMANYARKAYLAYEITTGLVDIALDIAETDLNASEDAKKVIQYYQIFTGITGGIDALSNIPKVRKVVNGTVQSITEVSKQGLINCLSSYASLKVTFKNVNNDPKVAKFLQAYDKLMEKSKLNWRKWFNEPFPTSIIYKAGGLLSAIQTNLNKIGLDLNAAKDIISSSNVNLKYAKIDGSTLKLTSSTTPDIDIVGNAESVLIDGISQVEIDGLLFSASDVKIVKKADGTIGCVGEGAFCFTAGTPIKVNNGFMPIENVTMGASVYSFDHNTKSNSLSKVTKLFKKTSNKLVKLIIGSTLLWATPEHPIFANGHYIQAKDLHVGDSVKTFNGINAKVESLSLLDTTVTVYNFEVENQHNYYVGADAILVHNSCSLKTVLQSLGGNTTDFKNFLRSNPTKKTDILNKLISLSTVSGKVNEVTLQNLTNYIVDEYNLITDATGKANLISYLLSSQKSKMLTDVKTWTVTDQNVFYTKLSSKPSSVNASSGFLIDKLSQLDDEMLKNYKLFTDQNLVPLKKYDFAFLLGTKNKSDDEILEYLDLDTRTAKSIEFKTTKPFVSSVLLVKTYKTNLLTSIQKIYLSGGAALDDFINIYKNDATTFNALLAFKGKSQSEVGSGLTTLFNGVDFNAHHISPMNLLYNSPTCAEIIEWANKNNNVTKPFKYNDIDNLIFLRDVNHTNGLFTHANYDKLLKSEIDNLKPIFEDNPLDAYNAYITIIDKYRARIISELIGSSPAKKLDDL